MKESHPATWRGHEFGAMGCLMSIWLETDSSSTAKTAFAEVESLFEVNEQAMSRFRPDSELSRLNSRTGQWVVVSDLLWNVLSLALEMATITGGYFDPTTLNALERAGYITTFEQLRLISQNSLRLQEAPLLGNWSAVELDIDTQAVYLPEGLRVDLGGIAKGYTAQQAVDLLRPYGPCLVDAGGDLAAGNAPMGYPGWPVAISAPWSMDGGNPFDLCQFWLADRALTSSGIDYRTWETNGRRQHHLIDPASGAPADTDCLTVTVLGNDGAQAEAWATAALVAGSRAGLEALKEAELAGLLVTQYGVVLLTPLMRRALEIPSDITF